MRSNRIKDISRTFMNGQEMLEEASRTVVGKSMLQTGATCSPIPEAGLKSNKVNRKPNAAGVFRAVKSLNVVEAMADEEVDSLLAAFPIK